MPLIEVRDVTRTFVVRKKAGRFRRTRTVVSAVADLSFTVDRGEFVGYLGPNGAGKSTTIKMLTGILTPTRGEVVVSGRDPFRNRGEVAYRVGAMFGQRMQLWWDLPLRDSFEQLRYIYRVGAADYEKRMAQLTEVLVLGPFLATPVRQLSLGQRMRGELAAAMLHAPELLFLDEPTIGLDVIAKQQIREFLRQVNREDGVTVLLTTHDLADLERMCSRLMLLAKGRLVSDGPIQQLFAAYELERTLVVDLSETRDPLDDIPGVRVARTDGPRQWLRFRGDTISPADVIAAVARRATILDLTIKEPDVEDLIRSLDERS